MTMPALALESPGRLRRAAACTVLLLAGSAPLPAQATRDTVWVNTRSGVYHCPGTEFYGKTSRGKFERETDAQREGFRPNGGASCHGGAMMLAQVPLADPDTREPRNPVGATEECKITKITDGDTFHCEPLGDIRLIGIDTPERSEEPFYTSSSAALGSWIPRGATLRLERDKTRRDRFNRELAYVWYDGRMVNWLMVRHGWAASARYAPDTLYARALDAAETHARSEGRGLWHVAPRARCFQTERRPGQRC